MQTKRKNLLQKALRQVTMHGIDQGSEFIPLYQDFRMFSQGRSNRWCIRHPSEPLPHLLLSLLPHLDLESAVLDSQKAF